MITNDKINYFYNFLNQKELKELFNLVDNISWGKFVTDIPGQPKYASHLCHTLIDSTKGVKPKEKILNVILKKIQEHYKCEYLPHNLYLNYYRFGDEIRVHQDRNTNKKNKTFIFYCTKQWDLNWHGNTLFYSQDSSTIIGGSVPYPNTGVCFDSDILHTSDPISKNCLEKRIILVYQLES